MSSCRQILGLLKTPLVTIHKRLNALSAEKAAQQAILCAPSNLQSSSPTPTTVNSSPSSIFQNHIPGARPVGTPCYPNAPLKEGYRRVTKEEMDKTEEAMARAREFGVY
jgi:hypothetical protein